MSGFLKSQSYTRTAPSLPARPLGSGSATGRRRRTGSCLIAIRRGLAVIDPPHDRRRRAVSRLAAIRQVMTHHHPRYGTAWRRGVGPEAT